MPLKRKSRRSKFCNNEFEISNKWKCLKVYSRRKYSQKHLNKYISVLSSFCPYVDLFLFFKTNLNISKGKYVELELSHPDQI